MKLTVFNGGLHTRPKGHLIQNNEARIYENIDNSSGVLSPIKDKVKSIFTDKKYAFHFASEDTWHFSDTPTDYVEFQNKLYFSDRLTRPKYLSNDTEVNVGITAPTIKPTLAVQPRPTVLDRYMPHLRQIEEDSGLPGTTSYSYILVNYDYTAETYSMTPVISVKAPVDAMYTIKFTLGRLNNGTVEYWDDFTDAWAVFRKLGDKYYMVGKRDRLIDLEDTDLYSILDDKFDISQNELLPLQLEGTVQYAMTFYNSTTGVESQPVLSLEADAETTQFYLTNLEVSADPQVDVKRIYRIGNELTRFTYVGEIANAITEFYDTLDNIDLSGQILTAESNSPPPDGLKYLIEAYAMLFGADGNKLRFTPIGVPTSWPELFYLNFPNEITGLGVTSQGIIVCTRHKTYRVTGTGPRSFAQQLLSHDQGCISHDTMCTIGGTAVWASESGICASEGGIARLVTQAKLGHLELYPINAIVHDEEYKLLLADGSILIMDFNDKILRTERTSIETLAIGKGKAYGFSNNALHELYANDTPTHMHYLSPVFIGSAYTKTKFYKTITLSLEGNITVQVLIDGELDVAETFNGPLQIVELKTSSNNKRGMTIELDISGTGTVYEIDIEELDVNN